MRRSLLAVTLVIMIFVIPALNTGQLSPGAFRSQNNNGKDGTNNGLFTADDSSSGTGSALPVSMTGTATNKYDNTMQIDSTTSGETSIQISDGWTGSDLQASVDTMTVTMNDLVRNGNLDEYHNEKFLTGTSAASGDVAVPDQWQLTKVGDSVSTHPNQGIFKFSDVSGAGRSGTMGWQFEAFWAGGQSLSSTDEIYISQNVHFPYRELSSVEVSFYYNVSYSSDLYDQVFLFVRFAGYLQEFHVFESGDTRGDWLQASVTVPTETINGVSLPDSLLLEVGLATDLSGTQSNAREAYVYVDDIVVTAGVRPFPEQIGLRSDGFFVRGSVSSGVSPMVPDDANRDCYDYTSGIDLDGFSDDGQLSVGTWGSSWSDTEPFQVGMQFPLEIPAGAVVTLAYLEVESAGTDGTPDMRIYAAGRNSSGQPIPPFTSGTPHLEDRLDFGEAGLEWLVSEWTASKRYVSPDIASLIQDAINVDGWQSGDYVGVMLDFIYASNPTVYNNIKGSSHYDDADLGRLYVEYLIPLVDDYVPMFQNWKSMTIDSTKVADDLADFPVLINITDSDLKTDVQTDGDDIAFVIDGQQVPHEIELFDHDYSETEAHLIAWVLVPSLSSTIDTTIDMYYGDSRAPPLEKPADVWTNGYAGVWHLNNDPSTDFIRDSSGEIRHGTALNMESGDQMTGQVDGALNFDGVDERVRVGNIDSDSWSAITVSLWIYTTDSVGDDRGIVKEEGTGGGPHIFMLGYDSGGLKCRITTDTAYTQIQPGSGVTLSTWHYAVMTWDSSLSTNEMKIYLNGALNGETPNGGSVISDSSIDVMIADNFAATRSWTGSLDEGRISYVARSANWIETEYNNQYDPSTFYSVGSEQAVDGDYSDTDTATMTFSTTSDDSVDLIIGMDMQIEGSGETLDENLEEGTSYFVANGSNFVNWTAKVLVSPPNTTAEINVYVDYPMTEWRPTTILDPLNQLKTYGTDWDYDGGTIIIYNSAVDIFGVWTLKFISANYLEDLQLGISGEPLSDTAIFNVADVMKLRATTPWIEGARVGLALTDPSGTVWHTDYNATGAPSTPWHIPSFQYRKTVTVSASNVDSDVTDFPFAVDFTDADLQKVQEDGSDIVFVQNGKVLAHEIVRFTWSSGRFIAWIKADLSSSVDTTLYMYYGNPYVGSCENRTGVWSNGYEAVWHLDEATGTIHRDSTSGGYDGVRNGNTATFAKVNHAQEFNGTGAYISIPAGRELDPEGDVTISGWFYLESVFNSSFSTQVLISKYLDADRDMAILLAGSDYSGGGAPAGSLVWKVESQANSPRYKWTTDTSWKAGWYHFSVYLDSDNMANNKIFINGTDRTDALDSGSATSGNIAWNAEWRMGGGYYEPPADSLAYLDGWLDEVTVSTASRTTDWISTQYKNQVSVDGYVSRGSETTRVSPEHTFTKTIDATAAAGIWTASTYYNDTGTAVSNATGIMERNFTVKHNTTLTLIAPGDATGDALSVRTVGDLLYVEVILTDDANSDNVSGATVTMNWTVSGSPTEVNLEDYGDGRYGKALNTTDLGDMGRWRINIDSYHPFYNNDTIYFDLDLSHDTDVTYQTPPSTPYGDDFTVMIYVYDTFTASPVTGAAITSNGTIVGSPTDHNNGLYSVTLESEGLNVGEYLYQIIATPSETYLLASNANITFTLRNIYTATYAIGGNSVSTPYNVDTSVTITYNDVDHSLVGIADASWDITKPAGITVILTDLSGGDYRVDITVGTTAVGEYSIDITMSKANYEDSTIRLNLTITPRDTYIVINFENPVPWGYNSTFDVSWYDSTDGTTNIGGTVTISDITVNSTSQGNSLSFGYDSSSLSVGSYPRNVTLISGDANYASAWTLITLEIRAHYTFIEVNHDETVPWGETSSFVVRWFDADTGGSQITTDLGSIVVGSDTFYTFSFEYDTSALAVGTYQRDVDLTPSSADYEAAHTLVNITVRAHYTFIEVNHDETVPWGETSSFVVRWFDADTGGSQITDDLELDSIVVGSDTFYTFSFEYDTSALSVGTYQWDVDLTPSSADYEAAHTLVNITVRAHYTFIVVELDQKIPWGINSSFQVTWYDLDVGSSAITGNLDNVTVDTQSFGSLIFDLDTDTWAVGTYDLNVTLYSSTVDYAHATTLVKLSVRAHYTFIEVNYDETVPWGETSSFVVRWFDADTGGSQITDDLELDSIVVGSDTFYTFSFEYDTSALSVGTYQWDVDLTPSSVNYEAAHTLVNITVRAHYTFIEVNYDETVPWGETSSFVVRWFDADTGGSQITTDLDSIVVGSDTFYTFSFEYDTSALAVGTYQRDVDLTPSSVDYESAHTLVNITIRAHFTYVVVNYDSRLPWGYQSSFVVSWHDRDVGDAQITDSLDNVTVGSQSFAQLQFEYDTSAWAVGEYQHTLTVYPNNDKYYTTSMLVNFTILAHETSVVVNAETNIPWGENSSFSVSWYDRDDGNSLISGSLENITVDTQAFYARSFDLVTDDWSIGTYRLDLVFYSSSVNYMHATTQVNITVRAHHTAVSVKGSLTVPYGNSTPITVVFWDTDWNVEVPIYNVSADGISFDAGAYGTEAFNNYTPTLSTGTWSVGEHSVTLTVTTLGDGLYYDNAIHDFSVTIRRLGIRVVHEPTDMIIPFGDDFNIILRVNVSEIGNQYDGDPVPGLGLSDLLVQNSTYTFSFSLSDLGNGRYNLTISNSELTDESYRITITIRRSGLIYGSDYITIEFSYRNARSYLSSPNYPRVITPYATDITISLNYTDVDRDLGITTGTLTAEGIAIYDEGHIGNGVYEVTLDVTGLDRGDHQFNITINADQYEAKTLSFILTIRIVYTYAIPSVGALDIPVGNDPVFYVDYWDTDHDVPVVDAILNHNWSGTVDVVYVSAEERYRLTFRTEDTDPLEQNRIVEFNFSKGTNYQFGIFTITVTIRTHRTDFRLVSAVEPTSYNGIINISLFYGDIDNNIGINSSFVAHRAVNQSGSGVEVSSSLVNDGFGYYTVQIPATQFGDLGTQNFLIFFNWTGDVYKYENKTITVGANIIGEDSEYTLLLSSEPTPYLNNMSYTFLYSELYSGQGISNASGNVYIYVSFDDESIDLNKIDIWEVMEGNKTPGEYAIQFSTTTFGRTGRFYMTVYINWSKGAEPFYTNRTDTISVRILPRDTLVSVVPPTPTAHGENATFSFTFDDVTGGESVPISDNVSLSISLSLADYSITYDSETKEFTVSFDTSQSPVGNEPLGQKSFILNVTWTGEPFYANRTGRTILVSVTARQTVVDYQSPAPTPYLDNVTFSVDWTDVTGESAFGIETGVITLYDGLTEIPATFYHVDNLGEGAYSVEFTTTYYAEPGAYDVTVGLHTDEFYILDVNTTRQFSVRYRVTLLSAEPVGKSPYNSSIEVILNFQDLLTLDNIANNSDVTFIIMNGSSWTYTIDWKPAFGYYLLVLDTYNHPELEVGVPFVLRFNMSYDYQSPYYRWDDTYVSFEMRTRKSSLELDDAPLPTAYLDYVDFAVFYRDVDGTGGISGATLSIYKGVTELQAGIDYSALEVSAGLWSVSVNTTALDGLGITEVQVRVNWSNTSPHHDNATLNVSLRTIRRQTNVEVISPPGQTPYLENVTFTFSFTDIGTGNPITGITIDQIIVYNGLDALLPGDYVLSVVGSFYEIQVSSAVIDPALVTNRNLTVAVDWDDGMAPYYEDDQTSVKVTTVKRTVLVSVGQVLDTPLGDLMNISFTYSDQDTGNGIEGAIVLFSCVEVPGLVENTDYWVTAGNGTEAGQYLISVDTDVLGGISAFTFYLDIHWDPTQQPYYRNATTFEVRGSTRLIQTSLSNDAPSPGTVPLNDEVSVIVTLNDVDHGLPVDGAGAAISVMYKGSGLEPADWSYAPLGSGQYNVTVDTDDAGGAGTKALVIRIDYYPYLALEVQVTFQIRLRVGVVSIEYLPDAIYAGDPTYVILNLTDADANSALLPDAVLSLTWPDSTRSWDDLGDGRYNISLGTSELNYGLRRLTVETSLQNYTIQTVSFDLDLLAVTTDLLSSSDFYELYFMDSQTFSVYLNDTVHDTPISDADVDWRATSSVLGSMTEISPGNYSYTLDTSLLSATTVVVRVTAQKPNYVTVSVQITLSILPLPVEIVPVDGQFVFSLTRGESVHVDVWLNETINGALVDGAEVTVSWDFNTTQLLSAGPGRYETYLNTEATEVKSYTISITGLKQNYLVAPTTLTVSVRQTMTVVQFSPNSQANYSATIASFFWSEIPYIEVYVFAPYLTGADANRSDAIVSWSLIAEGASKGGFLQNGSATLEGRYYLYLNTSDFDANTYTLRVSADVLSPAYTDNSTATTITIRNIRTAIEVPDIEPVYWGNSSWYYFSYLDTDRNLPVEDGSVTYTWADIQYDAVYVGEGVYGVFIDTHEVLPSPTRYPIVVAFGKQNFDSQQRTTYLRVNEIPTELVPYASDVNRVDDSSSRLQVPYGDELTVYIYYNVTAYPYETPYIGGIADATRWAQFTEPFDDLNLTDLGGGNYSFTFTTTDYEIREDAYRIIVDMRQDNRTRASISISIFVISVPTTAQASLPTTTIQMYYGDTMEFTVTYSDTWPGHDLESIDEAIISLGSDNPDLVNITYLGPVTGQPGTYRFRMVISRGILPNVNQQVANVNVTLSKENYDSYSVSLTVRMGPSPEDQTLSSAINLGMPLAILVLLIGVLWVRVFSVPKKLRKLNGQIKTLRKGNIPKPLDDAKDRKEIVAQLFNDTYAEYNEKLEESRRITRKPDEMPPEAVEVDIPEMGELLVQLSILTRLSPEELDEFKADIAKMRLSEQANFVKEVIHQEAIRAARRENKTVEEVIDEVQQQAKRRLGEFEGEVPETVSRRTPDEDLVILEETPERPKRETEELLRKERLEEVEDSELPADRLSPFEIEDLKKKLESLGVPPHEIDTILEQAKHLSREDVEELVRSLGGE